MTQRIPSDYIQRCYSGWLGKVIGVRHGAPIEGWTYEKIKRMIGEITGYLVDYRDFAADDDTNGPLFFLRALQDYGLEAMPEQVGLTWLNYAPYEHGFYWWGGYGISTEHTAYMNLRSGIMAPESGSIQQNGITVAEQIGGQIFCDTWGLITPSNPALAAEYAERGASVSHDGNGIYGARFVAAAIAAAFTEHDIRCIIETALKQIPEDCEYKRMADDIIAFYLAHKHEEWRSCMDHIIANWGYDRYGGNCHIIPNSAVMIMAMLYGEGDFSATINIGNMAGWDTDCNVGNIGTILGVMVGLEGIAEHWRRPINDFLVASSVVGCLNITNLPADVRLFCRLGYALAKQEVPNEWRDFINGKHFLDFELPGSTCAMRIEGGLNDFLFHENSITEKGHGSLRCVLMPIDETAAGEKVRKIYYKTYYVPSDLHDNRYDPSFSPILYPGQKVVTRVMTQDDVSISVCAFAHERNGGRDYRGEAVFLKKGEWTTVQVQIPSLSGALLDRMGIQVETIQGDKPAALYMDWLDFEGKADYTLDFAKEKIEFWTSRHQEVSQLTYLKGLWTIENGCLLGTCSDYGEAYTGNIRWKNVRLRTSFTRGVHGKTGICFRTQGAIRGYAVWVDGKGVSLLKNENGYSELARYNAVIGQNVELEIECVGSQISVFLEDKQILNVRDDTYSSGMIGFSVANGGHAVYKNIVVREL